MFYKCSSLTKLNLQNFNTNKVYDITKIFYGYKSLIDLNFPNYIINSKTRKDDIFDGCDLLQKNNILEKKIKKPNTFCINF